MFMNDVSIVVRKMCVYAERCMADDNVGFPEQIVLMFLKGQGPATQEQIAGFFELDKGAISKTLNKMEQKGLIVREAGERDKRQKIVSVTPEAETVIEHMTQVLTAWEVGAYQGISTEDAAVMERCMERMAANAHEMVKETAR